MPIPTDPIRVSVVRVPPPAYGGRAKLRVDAGLAHEVYAQTMLQRRRGMLLLGACVSLLFFVLNVINGQLVLAVIFGVLLVVNARGYLRR
jgi:hypothetical protein